jgi:hypothetical protein
MRSCQSYATLFLGSAFPPETNQDSGFQLVASHGVTDDARKGAEIREIYSNRSFSVVDHEAQRPSLYLNPKLLEAMFVVITAEVVRSRSQPESKSKSANYYPF